VLEKETKTKAYSKEGLSQSMQKKKKDPTKDPKYTPLL
jgi:CCR4-NOT transcriptional regulation complex NOT5 subunit